MPVPWGQAPDFKLPDLSTIVPAPKAADRAMTLRELRALADFVRRLCKVNLLKTSDGDHRLLWNQVSQHEICNLVIKRIIPQGTRCSWPDFVARKGQLRHADTFCCHYWGEPFRDFMAAVEQHAWDQKLMVDHSFWCCVSAFDQQERSISERLVDSPCMQALRQSQSTLLVLDRDCSIRSRAWCVLEFQSALELRRPISVGSALVHGAQTLTPAEVFENVSIAECVTSDPVDLRRILNHMVAVDERSGLMESIRDRRQCLVLDPTVGAPGLYEAAMLQTHESSFQAIEAALANGNQLQQKQDSAEAEAKNAECAVSPESLQHVLGFFMRDLVCSSASRHEAAAVKQSAMPKHHPGGCRLPKSEFRAVTLLQIRALAELAKAQCSSWDVRAHQVYRDQHPDGVRWDNVNMYIVCDFLIKPLTSCRACSYMELVSDGPLRCQYHVNQWWRMRFPDFIASLERFVEARKLPESTAFWVDAFALNWHSIETDLGPDVDKHPYDETIIDAEGLVVMLDPKATLMDRPFCILEQSMAMKLGKCVDYICPSGGLSVTRPFHGGGFLYGQLDEGIAERLLRIDCGQVPTGADDCEEILRAIGGSDGSGIEAFNLRLRGKAIGPVLRTAALEGSTESLEDAIAHCPPVRLNSSDLCGPFGQTPLHEAVSVGNMGVARYLIEHHADINSQDIDGETPLHYAALAAQPDSVRLLLEAHADAWLESYYLETPLQVAKQRPAFFLGLSAQYSEVHTLLWDDIKRPPSLRLMATV